MAKEAFRKIQAKNKRVLSDTYKAWQEANGVYTVAVELSSEISAADKKAILSLADKVEGKTVHLTYEALELVKKRLPNTALIQAARQDYAKISEIQAEYPRAEIVEC